jgi:hypothetical protein
MGAIKKALGGVGDIIGKASPLTGMIPGVGGIINTIAGGLGTLNDPKGEQGVTDFLKNAASGFAGGLGGGAGGAGGLLSSLASALGKQFSPTQRAVSGVPEELKSALTTAGINIEDLVAAGGALPEFGGRMGTGATPEQKLASKTLQDQITAKQSELSLGDFRGIIKKMGEIDAPTFEGTDGAKDIIKSLRGDKPTTTDTDVLLQKLEDFEGADITGAGTEASKIIKSLQADAPETKSTKALIDKVKGMADSPEQKRVIASLLPSLEKAAEAGRFDLTDMFKEGESVFSSDLDERLADIKAESSALGLGAGASDRNKRLLETAGKEMGRFRLGQEDIARQSFEDAERRRIAAIGAGSTVSDVIGRPAETLAGLLPAQLQQELEPEMIKQRGLAAALPSAVTAAGLGTGQELQALLGSLPTQLQAELTPEQIAQRGQEAALPAALEIDKSTSEFDLRKLVAGLDPTVRAALGEGEFDLAQRGQQSEDISNLFGMGSAERTFEESEIDRKMGEFARTQTGGYDVLEGMLGATPATTTAFGPSNITQLGGLAEGVSSVVDRLKGQQRTGDTGDTGGDQINQGTGDISGGYSSGQGGTYGAEFGGFGDDGFAGQSMQTGGEIPQHLMEQLGRGGTPGLDPMQLGVSKMSIQRAPETGTFANPRMEALRQAQLSGQRITPDMVANQLGESFSPGDFADAGGMMPMQIAQNEELEQLRQANQLQQEFDLRTKGATPPENMYGSNLGQPTAADVIGKLSLAGTGGAGGMIGGFPSFGGMQAMSKAGPQTGWGVPHATKYQEAPPMPPMGSPSSDRGSFSLSASGGGTPATSAAIPSPPQQSKSLGMMPQFGAVAQKAPPMPPKRKARKLMQPKQQGPILY